MLAWGGREREGEKVGDTNELGNAPSSWDCRHRHGSPRRPSSQNPAHHVRPPPRLHVRLRPRREGSPSIHPYFSERAYPRPAAPHDQRHPLGRTRRVYSMSLRSADRRHISGLLLRVLWRGRQGCGYRAPSARKGRTLGRWVCRGRRRGRLFVCGGGIGAALGGQGGRRGLLLGKPRLE